MSSFTAARSRGWSLERTEERRRSSTKASTRRRRRGRNGSVPIVVFAFSKGDGNANTIRPDTEWPPNDVSSDFRKAHVGSWTGKSATFDSRGNLIPIHEKFVPDAFKEFGVSVDDFDVKTVTSVDVSSGKGIDAAGLTHTTSYLYPEAGCEYGKEDVAFVDQTSKGICGGNSQLKKMFLVDGSYCEGPTTFQTGRYGTSTTSRRKDSKNSNDEDDENYLRFEFCFSRENDDFDVSERRQDPSPGRFRARIQIEKAPAQARGDASAEMLEKSENVSSDRKWVLRNVELIEERNDAALLSTARGLKPDFREAFESPATAVRIEGDDIGIGEWRPESGVTFVTLEALADVPEEEDNDNDVSCKESPNIDEDVDNSEDGDAIEKDGPAMRAWRRKPEDEALRLAMEAEKKEMKSERAMKYARKSSKDDNSNRNAPEGLVVVPWWAVKSDSSWASAPDYAVGGSSPLVLLPKRSWILIESANEDEFTVEMGTYVQDFAKSELRRKVMARRYKRGRLASCYFVTERQLSQEEIEEEERRIDEEIGAF